MVRLLCCANFRQRAIIKTTLIVSANLKFGNNGLLKQHCWMGTNQIVLVGRSLARLPFNPTKDDKLNYQ
jgi:hypothetical protein